MLRIAPVTATSRLDDALTLSDRFPATMTALTAGRITLCKARIIAEQTEQLSPEHAAAVEDRALGRATTQTPGQLRRAVRRAVNRADPAAVRRRHQAARTADARRADALVDLVCGAAGYTSTSTGTATAEAALPRSQRRRMRRRRSRIRVQMRVTVPFSTLFGLDEQPGELAGYGTITADQARELAG